MNINYLSVFCLLALSASGCAQHMAKMDSSTPPAATAGKRPDSEAQAKVAAPQATTVQNADHATAPSGTTLQPKKVIAAKTAKSPTPQETAAASKLVPLPSKEIVDTISKLTSLSRVRYLSRSAQYVYYVGGKIEAKYDIKKAQLMVTNAPADEKNMVTCAYSKNGKMIYDRKTTDQKVEECDRLINELTMYLDR
jgi:hypothetical protein